MRSLTANGWVQYGERRPTARIRLFCFPYAGGGASIFRTWHESFPPEVEVCPVQFPGREGRLLDAPLSDLHALVDCMATALSPFLDVPYAFFGHSMGALIGFEFARYLRRGSYNLLPFHLFFSGKRAPQLSDLDPPTSHLPEPEFIEELRRLKGTPESVLQNMELLRLLSPLLRADFRLCETYLYKEEARLDVPITALGGLYDTEVTRQMVAAWREQAGSTFKLRFFEGDHFFLHTAKNALLLAILQDLLTSFSSPLG